MTQTPLRRTPLVRRPSLPLALLLALLAGCSTTPPPHPTQSSRPEVPHAPDREYFSLDAPAQKLELVLYAMGLLDTGYRFGGRNPEAGLDCSGMVSYIVEQISGRKLPHNAASIADQTRPIDQVEMQPGDLVFFNTQRRRHSHMGIYIGDGKFIHAPSSRGAVRVERLDSRYFAPRIDGIRTLAASG
ncbi:C40 family peptidase [Azoarcus sp. L1K30]|uniref:C40 family peptidase n=1 Tax=Azoarcus sp. L1K30 TaxID=2820277 RepID=UPI0032C21509